MKNDPENSLELIKKIVMLSSLGTEFNKKNSGNKDNNNFIKPVSE